MTWKSTTARYGSLAITFHWLMLLLIVAVYAAQNLNSLTPKGSGSRAAMATWHYMLGLSVFVLVWLRLLIRAVAPTPRIAPPPAVWEARLAGIMHFVLYAFMIGMPILGWLTLSAQGEPVPFFGFELPALIGKNKGTAKTIKDIHESIATIGYFLIGLHAIAALYHHNVKRDNTLRMMWWRG